MARSQRSGFNGFVEVDRAGRMKFVAVLLLVGAVFAFLMSAYYRGDRRGPPTRGALEGRPTRDVRATRPLSTRPPSAARPPLPRGRPQAAVALG